MKRYILLAVLPFTGAASTAAAQSDQGFSFGSFMLSEIVPILITLGIAIVVALAVWGTKKLADKLGVENSVLLEQSIRDVVRFAIAGAEEAIQRKDKDDWYSDENRSKGADKAQWVVDRVMEQFPNLAPKSIEQYIDEELAQMRGVGATDRAVGVDSKSKNESE